MGPGAGSGLGWASCLPSDAWGPGSTGHWTGVGFPEGHSAGCARDWVAPGLACACAWLWVLGGGCGLDQEDWGVSGEGVVAALGQATEVGLSDRLCGDGQSLRPQPPALPPEGWQAGPARGCGRPGCPRCPMLPPPCTGASHSRTRRVRPCGESPRCTAHPPPPAAPGAGQGPPPAQGQRQAVRHPGPRAQPVPPPVSLPECPGGLPVGS